MVDRKARISRITSRWHLGSGISDMIDQFPNPIAKSKTLSDSKSRGKSSDRGRRRYFESGSGGPFLPTRQMPGASEGLCLDIWVSRVFSPAFPRLQAVGNPANVSHSISENRIAK